jgi:hypothetical protein
MWSLLHYLGSELLVEEGGVHGEECFVAAMLDGAFAMAVNKDGALLGLRGTDAADVDEGLDDVVEGVYVVVVEH